MWKPNSLYNDLYRLTVLYNKETDLKKKNELSEVIYYVEKTLNDMVCEDKPRLFTEGLYSKCTSSIPRFKPYIQYVYDFLFESNKYVDNITPRLYTSADYTAKDMYELADAFYKSIGGKTYEAYQRINKEKAHRLNFTQLTCNDSTTYYIPILDKYYINLGVTDGKDEDVIEAYIHEVGHVITARKNNYRYFSEDILTEIETYFYEILADRYLLKLTNDEYFDYLEKDKMIRFNCRADLFARINNAYNRVLKDVLKVDNHEEVMEKYTHEEGIEEIENYNIEVIMVYVLSYMFAIELASIYEKDKDKALYLLDKIIENRKDISEYEKIMTNIEPNKHLKRYVKELKKVKE